MDFNGKRTRVFEEGKNLTSSQKICNDNELAANERTAS
jgi:hypothetical protein